MFNRAKKGLQGISSHAKNGSEQEKRVAKNVSSSLALSLQDLSVNFRKSQSTYLKSESATMPVVMGVVSLAVCLCVCMYQDSRTEKRE